MFQFDPRQNFRAKLRCFFIALALLDISAARAQTNALLVSWLNAQTNIQTWSADFTQTRTLKSLVQPLTATGHVWFEAPNLFRWELGHPAETIAVRERDALFVIYPRLKRAERYPLTGGAAGQWRDVFGLLDAGFPRSEAELTSEYNILGQTVSNQVCKLALEPKSASARRMMPQIKIGFSTENLSLRSTELQFADGSTLRNDFTNAVLNPKLDASLFEPKPGSDYKITEPLKK